MYTFVPNKSFGRLLKISQTKHIFLKTFNSEFQNVEVWFTYQSSQPLEIEDLIVLKKSITKAIKTASKRAVQKTAEVSGDLISNKIADKITSVSKELDSKKILGRVALKK